MVNFFKNFPEVLAVMSERKDGPMKLLKDSEVNLKNRKKFFAGINPERKKIISAEIVHGNKTEIVDSESPELIFGADGLISKDKKIFLSVTIADCIPVYFYDPEKQIFGIAHCGWRGIVAGIAGSAVGKMKEAGGKPENLLVALGPGIGKCHFEIKEDVLEKFSGYENFIERRDGKIIADLKGIIKLQLQNLGVPEENIENDPTCTFESDRFFSFRRDRPKEVEAMVAAIGMK